MGLLDTLINGSGDPEKDARLNQGLLQAGLALMQSRGKLLPSLGQAGQAGLQAGQQLGQQQAQRKRGLLQDQLLQGQVAESQRAQELAQLPGQFYRAPSQPGVDATGGMDTAMEAPGNQAGPGGFDMPNYIQALMAKSPVQALQLQASLAKPKDRMVVGKDQRVYQDGKLLIDALPEAPKEDKDVEFLKTVYGDGTPEYKQALRMLATKKTTHQPATSVRVDTGQKGYDNESKLRNDFKSEPIYKDFQDMDQAYKQIKAGLSAKTPIGDVAAATKIMKLLDPGSVVRESELAISMAAAGKLDRLQNYVQMKISGESLTPQQRVDFESLAGELHAAAAQAYNAKRMEYENTGKRYGLDPSVLGAASPPMQKPAAKTGLPEASAVEAEVARRARLRGGQ